MNHRQSPKKRQTRFAARLAKITIKGFKSLENIDTFALDNINILVGANGTGKSNFLSFFDMLGWMMRGKNLQEYIAIKGGGDDLLFNGSKKTRSIDCEMTIDAGNGQTEYGFALQHTTDDRLIFSREECRFNRQERPGKMKWKSFGIAHEESKIATSQNDKTALITKNFLQNCVIYQFHDTSDLSPLKQKRHRDDNVFLKASGGNLAPILFDLQQNENQIYQEIVDNIRLVLPVFRDFDLRPHYDHLFLRWTAKGNQDKSFGAHLTSDGTLRFIALMTLLCLPEDRLADVILLDEPELGLHPYAISLIADLIKRLGKTKQIVIATQSPFLLNAFDAGQIVVASMSEYGATVLKRLNQDELQQWLDEYKMGDLWQKNIFGGNPQ